MRKDFSDLTIVMIARNEEKAIGKVVSEIIETLSGVKVYVIDGSTDRTAEIAKNMGAEVFQEPGGGYGPALHSAIQHAKTKYVGTVDADDTYPPEHFKEMLELMDKGYDIVGGSRITPDKPKTMPLFNFAANQAFSLISSAVLFSRTRDIHSGMRVYVTTKIQSLNWATPDLGFTVELLLFPIAMGWRITEIPIGYRERIGNSQLMKIASAKATVVSIGRSVRLKYAK